MSVGSIYEEVIKTEAGRTMLQERVEACLDQLSATSSYLPAFVIEMDDSYVVGKLHPKSSQLILVFKLSFYFLLLFGFADFKSIISVAQKDEVCFIFSYFPEIFLKLKMRSLRWFQMEAVVMRRYGKEAFRMFRYLSQEGRFVETDKVKDCFFWLI